jgi:hypothetical protein
MKVLQLLTVLVLSCVFTSASSQQKAQIKIHKNLDGSIQEIDKEVEIKEGQDISELLQSLNLLDEFGNLKEGETFEIILRKSKDTDILQELQMDLNQIQPKLQLFNQKAFLGVILKENLDPISKQALNGATVTEVVPGSAAEKAELEVGDVILKVNDLEILNTDDLVRTISEMSTGELVDLLIKREGNQITVTTELGARHDSEYLRMPKNFELIFPTPPPPLGLWQGCQDKEPKAFLGVYKDSETDKGVGIQAGDMIREINGQKVTQFSEIVDVIAELKPGDDVVIKIFRDGKRSTMKGQVGSDNGQKNFGQLPSRYKGCDENGTMHFDFNSEDLNHSLDNMFEGIEDLFSDENLPLILEEIERVGEQAQALFEGSFNYPLNETRISIFVQPLTPEDLEVLSSEVETSLPEFNSLEIESLEIYPNPTNDTFRLSFLLDSQEEISLKLIDSRGGEIKSERITDNPGRIVRSFNVAEEASGVYYLIITQGTKTIVKKIVKQD